MRWIKSLVINGLLVLASVAIMFAAIEVFLHFTPLWKEYMYPLNMSKEYFHWDPVLGYDIVPNTATTTHEFSDLSYEAWSNGLGCYDYPYNGQAPYIYLAGDSFAWGYTPLDQKWGKVIERSTGIRTLTCGVPGYGTRQEVIKAQRIIKNIPQTPTLIIVAHFDDDASDDAEFPNYTAYHGYVVPAWVYCEPQFMLATSPLVATTTCTVAKPNYPLIQQIKTELAAHSILYLIAKRRLHVVDTVRTILLKVAPEWLQQQGLVHEHQALFDNHALYFNDSRYWDIHLANLQAFKMLADTTNSKLVVVLIPTKEAVEATSTDPQSNNGRTKAYLSRHGIPYIDLLPVLHAVDPTSKVLYWPDDVHWTPAGNALVGQVVSDYIAKEHLL